MTRLPLRLLAPAALLFAFLLAGCGDRAERNEDAAPATGAANAPLDSSKIRIEPVDAAGLAAAVRAPGARATLVNVWASWCQPCREEFPDLLKVAREWEDRGFRLVFVSADFAEDVPNARQFLAEQGVGWTTYLKTGDDMQFIDTLDPRWSGALPGSFLYDSGGRLVRFWEGKASEDSLRARILPVLDAAPSS
jgi:thiol-disulfide isomerase/thioredoxin